MFLDLAVSVAAKPEGPAPTITRSSSWPPAARRLSAIASTACRPCSRALRMSAPPPAAEHQRDGIDRTGGLACAVADAIPGTHQDGPPADDAEDRVVRLFRASLDARAAADTSRGINDRVKRRRFW